LGKKIQNFSKIVLNKKTQKISEGKETKKFYEKTIFFFRVHNFEGEFRISNEIEKPLLIYPVYTRINYGFILNFLKEHLPRFERRLFDLLEI